MLKQALSHRAESQIKAHHLKLMKKYGSIDNIIQGLDHRYNRGLLSILERL